MRRILLAATLAVLSPLVGCGAASGTARPGEASRARQEAEGAEQRRTLALYLDGQRVGEVDTRQLRRPDGTVRVEDRLHFAIERVNSGRSDRFTMESSGVTEYGADAALRSEESVKTEAGVVERSRITIESGQLVLAYEGPAQRFEKRFDLPPGFRSSRGVFLELAAEYDRTGAEVRRDYVGFSSDEQRFVQRTMEITGRRTVRHGRDKVGAYDVIERSDDGTVVDLVVDADFLPIAMDLFGTLSARWVEDGDAAPPATARITSELAVDGDIERWWDLEALEVRVTVRGDDPDLRPVFPSTPYQAVARSGETYRLRLSTSRTEPGDARQRLPLAGLEADVARFLAPTPLSQSDDRDVIAAARRIVGDEKAALAAAARIVGWVHESLEKRAGVRGNATATEVLAALAGDCTEHAALTVALARAAGLPARNVDGIVLAGGPDGRLVAGYHAWAEVWVGRWIGVDAVFGEVGTTARYLAFGYNEPGEIGPAASLSRTVGKTSIAVEGYKLFGAAPVSAPRGP